MVARQFFIGHDGEEFPIEYDTNDGIEVLKFQIFSLTSVHPDDQKIVIEDGEVEVTEASDLGTISEKLRLVSFQDEDDDKGKELSEVVESKSSGISDEELAKVLQAEDDAIAMQMFQDSGTAGRREFEQRVQPIVSQVLMYEDGRRKEAACKSAPIDRIEEKALVSLGKEGNLNPSKEEKDHAFLLQLLYWFKQSFSWVNSPPCDNCGSETTFIGMGSPLPAESHFSCSRVELFRCQKYCSRNSTRFPRYNDPLKLLETKRGRCGEWANCFTLYCRAFNYDSRLILDFTDHVWTECFSHLHGRWMHLDPCEGVYDNPLLYEKGWNKNLSYVIAISKDDVRDVTKRYTRKWHEILSRRNITTEASVSAVLSNLTSERRIGYSREILSILESHDKKEEGELGIVHLQNEPLPSLPGRQSGSKEWRLARSELGSGENDSSCDSSCPVRTCFDSHVCNIHCSLTHLVSNFIGTRLSKSEVAKNLEILRKWLVDLKSSSFKVRKVFIDFNSLGSKLFKENSSFVDEFLFALSLKRDSDSDEKICITLAGNPVLTSIALPVALHDIDETIRTIRRINHLDQSLISNFSRLNRISCGSVLASGEQLPSGIATKAFDGCRLSKWEEPNGAKGCWLIYKVKCDQMHVLEAYDLMSANDAPERDPMDWILEGSEDGGSSWNILDQQIFQTFENRFQRRRFKVTSGRKCNIFRFRFLKVRDQNSQPRFQVGTIDLYANEG